MLVYVTPAVVLYSLWAADAWAFTAVIVLFGFIPLLELFTKGSQENLSEAEEAVMKEDKIYDFFLYSLLPLQYLILWYFLNQVSLPESHKVGLITAFGMSCGVLGINAAHELGHRNSWYEQLMSKLLLFSTLYMHFFIEHNRGHHKNVSTDEDPASSRYGETVYAFYVRSIIGSWLSAWRLEQQRLEKIQKSVWSWHNEMLRFQVAQAALLGLIGWYFGTYTMLYYVFGALMGILLLETVNYIEHYGLRRKKVGNHYERTMPIHSWNSNHPIGRLMLLELSRHSDHHYMANRKYQTLRYHDDSPQMPTGYPGMMLLSFVPPIWFWVMHRAIARYKQTHAGEALA